MCSQCFKAKHKTQPPSELTHTKAKSPSSLDDTSIVTTIEKSRKHLRNNKNDEKPIQVNKSKCFSCRLKVPLAKQATNKCRCGYVFCDKHRYPDRHDCDVDYAKMDREILARNNPKLNERPKGGRSFQRIDSL
ncbi:hypothetical protein BD560DRAFT_371886 [Blakeslea trispora]|nr:hypothetical protein BD560DRAFT_371886 [Blakeslea trispora]